MADEEYQIIDPKKGWSKIVLLGAAFVLAVGLVGAGYFWTKVNQAASSESVPAAFTVNKGWSTQQIANKLDEQKIIGSPTVFVLYAKMTGAGNKIQAGNYQLDRNMSIAEIIDVLTKGKVVRSERKVTIVEGWSNRRIAEYLESRAMFASAQWATALQADYDFEFAADAKQFGYEGFLFPDTYTIAKDAEAAALVQKMLTHFEIKLTEQMRSDMQARNLKLVDVIILASIVEREVGRNKQTLTDEDEAVMQRERTLVASVFYNRLKIGMALESDATVNYVTGKNDRRATFEDIKIKSPYNTYVNKGLPPGPIGNPGIDSIKAVINPAQSDYYFFLNDKEGVAYFGRTLAEHNSNRAKYLD